MRYCGPEIKLPVQESGVAPKIECVPLESAELILGSKDDVVRFLANKESGVVVFDASGELLRLVSRENIVLVGGHALSGQEREFVKARNIQVFQTSSMMHEGITNICDAVMEYVNAWPALHVCVSLSILDSEQFPGGLSVRELLYFMQRLRMVRNYASGSVVGVPSPVTVKVLSELWKAVLK